ncbi:MCM2/3/5 family-domain-containing protein [Zopfochytrium polystomum]|nr:MCM2/3/5 family-domain-containing protein [Zopfochytrium polystomum]
MAGGAASATAILSRLEEFVLDFRLGNDYFYRDQINSNIMMKQYFLEVNLAHLSSFDEDLSNYLKERPADVLPLFEVAVKAVAKRLRASQDDLPDCQVMLLSDSNPTHVRDLDATFISKLVKVRGIAISAGTLSVKATHVHIMCKACRSTRVLPVSSGFASVTLPRNCLSEAGPTGQKDCPIDPYVIVHDKCRFVDMQTLKVQETPDMVPVGELPRHILISADRYLAAKAVPGLRVSVTGIYSIFQQESAKRQGAVAIRTPYLRLVGMEVDRDGERTRSFTPQEEEEFLTMSRRPHLYEEFANSMAPSIFGSTDIKKAIACLLFGGSKKILPDGMKLRGDINVLLLGDPGTAKSQLLKFVEKVAPTAVYTSGKGSSAAGLTASVVRDASTREFYLEAGAMVLADGGVVCIDEFDKMREEDRVAIHEAMEQQTISIAKAGITTILNSRTSVLAAANPVFGRYDDMKSAAENIDFQSTILSRFDLIFVIKDEHNMEMDKSVAKHVLGVHMNVQNAESQGDIPIEKMRGACKCAPRLSEEAAQLLSSHFVEVRGRVRGQEAKTAIPITIRQLEAIARISESLAKLSLSPHATERHVNEAIRLFNISTMSATELAQNGPSNPQFAAEVDRVQDYIRRRLAVGSQIGSNSLTNDLVNRGFSERSIEKAIYIMQRQEVLTYANRRMLIKRIKP